jgi:hypothetical protein
MALNSTSSPKVQQYVEGRITVAQYLQLGQEYGYSTPIKLYLCGSGLSVHSLGAGSRKSSSHQTPCWRETDSNHRSLATSRP